MSTTAYPRDDQPFDRFGSGLTLALVLHGLVAAGIVAFALLAHIHGPHWGSDHAQAGAIQASMVSAIPLPPKAVPVDKSVLTSENESNVPAPPPRAATQPPPKPGEVLIKGRTPQKAAPKPNTVTPPKHPQPTPDTTKAASGDVATQFPHALTQTKNGTATVTVEDKAFGTRYSYYLQIVSRTVNENYNPNEADPRASQGRSVSLLFNIEHDGSITNLHVENRSGSPSLDAAAMRAIQHIDSFPQLPAGDHITIEFKFDYHQS